MVGLTGGIAAGKSTVARMFAELGAAVVDADQVAHEVTAPGTPAHAAVVAAFGPGVLDEAGRIDRRRLGPIVFRDPEARRRLEAITHPAIVEASGKRFAELGAAGHGLVIYEAALLVETGRHEAMDVLVVVVADDERRVHRLMSRNNLSREEAERRLRSQLPQEEKARLADYVIDNSTSVMHTRAQVEEAWRRIRSPGPEAG